MKCRRTRAGHLEAREADRLISEREGSEGAAGHLEIIESTDYPWGTQTGG